MHALCSSNSDMLVGDVLSNNIYSVAAIFSQHVNLRLFEDHVLLSHLPETEIPQPPALTSDEANALRYAAGYVPSSLKRKLAKRFGVWLDRLSVTDTQLHG